MGIYKNQAIIEADEELIRQQRKEIYDPEPCITCDGWGAIENGHTGMKEACPDCDGEGSIENKRTK